MQLLPGGFPSSVPPSSGAGTAEWEIIFASSQGRAKGEKRSAVLEGLVYISKENASASGATGFWLRTEPKGLENDLGDLGCWHLTEPSLGPGLLIQSGGSAELPQDGNLGVKAVISPSHEKDKLGRNKLLLYHVLSR